MDRCDGCGFDYDLGLAPQSGMVIISVVAELADLVRTATDVRVRREPELWSPLEYGCHVRDVLLVQRERVLAARIVDVPSFDPMRRDERVEFDGYAEQDPDRVAVQLGEAAFLFANVLARFAPSDWERTVRYNYPKPWERPLRWVAVHTEHEVTHHLLDIRHQL
jgi:DinB superfamily